MRAVFLDRDGVINENRPDHVKSWDEFRFLPGSLEALARLTLAGVRAFVITNQAVVNRGMVPRSVVDDINNRMLYEIERCGGRVEDVIYCPHRPEEHCGCRKPQPGLILELARRHSVELGSSVVIGDALADIEAGQAAGCQTILVLTGRGVQQLAKATAAGTNGFLVAFDLGAAVDLLLQSTPTLISRSSAA
jgi:D-glycero-D-manno-heptose 1,7-bisphosphate phosphatase